MEKEFIITSTNNIEGGKIVKYFGVINNNVVVGTNLFSDIGASFLDIFGGTSSSYQNKLKNIYETSVQNLKIKARELGANAILYHLFLKPIQYHSICCYLYQIDSPFH